MNGIGLRLFTRKNELIAAKKGITTMVVAYPEPKGEYIYGFTSPLDACDFFEDEVRVNTELLTKGLDDLGVQFGQAMGQELEKIFAKME